MSDEPRAQLEEGRRLLDSGDPEAATAILEPLTRHPDANLAGEAWLLIGAARYRTSSEEKVPIGAVPSGPVFLLDDLVDYRLDDPGGRSDPPSSRVRTGLPCCIGFDSRTRHIEPLTRNQPSSAVAHESPSEGRRQADDRP